LEGTFNVLQVLDKTKEIIKTTIDPILGPLLDTFALTKLEFLTKFWSYFKIVWQFGMMLAH